MYFAFPCGKHSPYSSLFPTFFPSSGILAWTPPLMRNQSKEIAQLFGHPAAGEGGEGVWSSSKMPWALGRSNFPNHSSLGHRVRNFKAILVVKWRSSEERKVVHWHKASWAGWWQSFWPRCGAQEESGCPQQGLKNMMWSCQKTQHCAAAWTAPSPSPFNSFSTEPTIKYLPAPSNILFPSFTEAERTAISICAHSPEQVRGRESGVSGH